jgi:hypothetical protein
MSPVEDQPQTELEPAAAPPKKAKDPLSKFASREDWLKAASHLNEAEVEIDGIGLVLLSEISGTVRANILAKQSQGLMGDVKTIDVLSYQRSLLQAGIVDPISPRDSRVPMFAIGDMDRVMKMGGASIGKVIDKIEQLSSLGNYQGGAEENSAATPNGDGTSG